MIIAYVIGYSHGYEEAFLYDRIKALAPQAP
jgi:hypothetical protein